MTVSNHQRRTPANAARKAESDRILPLFLRWVGKRHEIVMLGKIGVGPDAARRWLAGRRWLTEPEGSRLRIAMGDEGGSP